MNWPAALKATLVAATIPTFVACVTIWPHETGGTLLIVASVGMLVVLWVVAYENFILQAKRHRGDQRE